MDVDPIETVGAATEAGDANERVIARLNSWVAITVALLATFMAICKVKDDNICQAMQQAQADKIDHWAYYQARNLRLELAQATVDDLSLASAAVSADAALDERYRQTIVRYQALVTDQSEKKKQAQEQAEQDQNAYDRFNFRDDQFDLSDALLAISITLLAVTALTHKRWMYFLALIPIGFGVLMGLAGLFGWPFHPNALIAFLGT